VKVPNDEELANHIVPESCAAYREVRREALTGVHIGQQLSREMDIPRVPTPCLWRKATRLCAINASAQPTRRGHRTWHVCTLLVREPGDLGFDQPTQAGPHWEGEEP
jgi:hypothetical protein